MADQAVRVFPFPNWADAPSSLPRPWLINVGGHSGTTADWYMEGVRQFFAAIAAHQPGGACVTKRSKPLVALPRVGIGHGGARHIKGDIIRLLLTTLYEAVQTHDLDSVLVVNNGQAFAAAQNARRQIGSPGPGGAWSALASFPTLINHAQRLACHATKSKLALFLGAGIGKGAGLPDWQQPQSGSLEQP